MNRPLYITVFTAGMTTLAIEFSASRLLGSVFGTSNLVWASIIGLILIYLTAGYFLGGKFADRSPNFRTLFILIAWGAFFSGLVPLLSRPVLKLAADAFDQLQIGVLLGSFVSVLVLFSLPVTLLGMVSPFAIRLAISDAEHAGQVSGRIYAISTLGSFIGTFLPVLVFIPLVGTTWTFIIFSEVLLLVSIYGMWKIEGSKLALRYVWMPLFLILLGAWYANRPIKDTAGQIFETESAYNYIQVIEQDDYRLLRLNEGQGIHSVWHPTELDYHGPWEQFLAAPFFNPSNYALENVESMAIVGLAAGTVAHQATEVFGPIQIDGYEIDPEIIAVGRRYFEMTEPNLNAIAEDGRLGLERSDRRYTMIGIDAYRPPYIPWQLTTVEFFRSVYRHLAEDGVLAINVGRAPNDRRLIAALAATIQQVFPSVYVMDVPESFNSMIYATVQPTEISDFYNNMVALYARENTHPLLIQAMERVVLNLQPVPVGGQVFTDDRAPIEWLTNNLVINYVLFGELQNSLEGAQ